MLIPQLYSLAYISKNHITGNTDEIKNQIQQILNVAHQNNPKKGITGALLYSGGYFCQVIEGPKSALEDLFMIIELDKRHKNVAMLHCVPIKRRVFEGWAMAFAGIRNNIDFDIEGILASKNELKINETGKNLLNILESLVKQY